MSSNLPYDAESADESAAWEADEQYMRPEPTWSKPCDTCGDLVERYRGEGDVQCGNGHWYNAGGQRLRDNWMGNRSNWDDDVSDMDGYEEQMIREDW